MELFGEYPTRFQVMGKKTKVLYSNKKQKDYKLKYYINDYYPLEDGKIITYIKDKHIFVIYNHKFEMIKTIKLKSKFRFEYFVDMSPNENYILFVADKNLSCYDRESKKLSIYDAEEARSVIEGKFLNNTFFFYEHEETIIISRIDNFNELDTSYVRQIPTAFVNEPTLIDNFIILYADEGIEKVEIPTDSKKNFKLSLLYPDSKNYHFFHVDKNNDVLYGFSSNDKGQAKITQWDFTTGVIRKQFTTMKYSGGLPDHEETIFQEIMEGEYKINIPIPKKRRKQAFRINKEKIKQQVKDTFDKHLSLVPPLRNIIQKFIVT